MNSKLLLITISIITLASCSTAYKTGQTPDDVYYSPARFYDEDKREDNKKDEEVRKDYAEERQIRMGINNPRWRYFDNDIYYSPYNYGYNYGYYYNPYYCTFPVYNTIVVKTPNPKNTTPRMVNLGGYGSGYNNNNNNNAVNTKTGNYTPVPVRSYNNSNTGSRLGNTLNKIFNNSNSSSNSSSGTNRTYTPSSSSSSSSSSSGSSSSGSSTSRPARSGKGG
ncbi:MAG: hypothetical protein IPP72_19195 [Chitinophagaceae bacterium]|nr:hypothetical protein [Chitinophagaceae bacterium]